MSGAKQYEANNILAAVLMMIAGGASAADFSDLKTFNASAIAVSAPEPGILSKSEAAGPAKSASAGFSLKDSEQKKGSEKFEPSTETKNSFGRNFGQFDKSTGFMACYNATPNDLPESLSIKLCAGAVDTSPADCYKRTPTDLDKERSVNLCMGARNTGPADCYNRTPTALDKESSVELCMRAANTGPADCYNATPNSLPMNLSVLLCTNSRDTSPAACYLGTPQSWSRLESVYACMPHYYPGKAVTAGTVKGSRLGCHKKRKAASRFLSRGSYAEPGPGFYCLASH